jgi:hypothetical protein
MGEYEQVSDFFCELCNFANERHLLLTTRAKGKTAPLAAVLAQREYEQSNEMYHLSTKLVKALNAENDVDEYDIEQHKVSSELMYKLATKLMDSFDLNKLVFGLNYAKEFLRRDLLMDAVAVELIDNPSHHSQLEQSARLFVQVNSLLKLPKLASIEPKFNEAPPPWIGKNELKTDIKLQLYAFQQLSQKKSKILEILEMEESADLKSDLPTTQQNLKW